MGIRYLYILIGFVITLNSVAQDISKPSGINLSQKEPDKSKEKTSSKADTPIQKTYNTNSSQLLLSPKDMCEMGDKDYEKGNYTKAIEWYRKSAEQGYARAQYNLGVMYQNGYGISQDYTEAVKWCRKAAEQGDATAQSNLGWMYQDGKGVVKDVTEAVKWYRKSAEQGDARAQSNLGIMYETGKGVSKDIAEAVKWYQKAAKQGYRDAQENLIRLKKSW